MSLLSPHKMEESVLPAVLPAAVPVESVLPVAHLVECKVAHHLECKGELPVEKGLLS
jgi:hypothetical protein